MNNLIKFAWYILMTTLTMFILVSADVFGHGEGQCLKGQSGSARLSNGGWVKVVGHLSGTDFGRLPARTPKAVLRQKRTRNKSDKILF